MIARILQCQEAMTLKHWCGMFNLKVYGKMPTRVHQQFQPQNRSRILRL